MAFPGPPQEECLCPVVICTSCTARTALLMTSVHEEVLLPSLGVHSTPSDDC